MHEITPGQSGAIRAEIRGESEQMEAEECRATGEEQQGLSAGRGEGVTKVRRGGMQWDAVYFE